MTRAEKVRARSEGASLLAGVLRRLLAVHHIIHGTSLRVDAEITDLTDEEFDAVWDVLDTIDANPLLRATQNAEESSSS